jgi:hypothetical protein
MDQELKSHLEAMESRLNSRVDQAESRLLAHVDARSNEVESRLLAHIDQSEERSRSHTETIETRLLNEFWKWAKTADARYRQHQAVVGGLDIRVQTIEDRLSDLERRKAS